MAQQENVAEPETSEKGQNGQRVNDIICPLDNPIEAIRFTEPLDKFCAGASILGSEEVEIAVEYCGLRHSDLSILNNDWGFVPISCHTGA